MRCPQPPLRTLVLQTLPQLRCRSLDTLRCLSVRGGLERVASDARGRLKSEIRERLVLSSGGVEGGWSPCGCQEVTRWVTLAPPAARETLTWGFALLWGSSGIERALQKQPKAKQIQTAMQIPIFTVDAFTNQPFSGNPAAVCLLENDLDEDLHQKIATEMNLSETAFIRKLHPGDDFTKSSCFGLRWFTPANEVPLCGHATLASAAVLFHVKKNTNSVLTFVTLSGELKAKQVGDHIVLDLPAYSTYPQVLQEVEELVKAAVGDLVVQDLRYSPDTKKLLVRLSDTYERSVLEELQVRAQQFLQVEKTGKVKGLILTLKGNSSGKDKGRDFYSRYFAPWHGVLEDPVTGSAHAVLGSYWSEQLGKKEMLAFQCSRRGGELKISLRDDGRVDIAGQSAVVLKGNLTF